MTNIEDAKTIVKGVYPNANEVVLEDVLKRSQGVDKTTKLRYYRPYWVAAFLILTEYRRLKKADDVTFEYDVKETVEGLLSLARSLDNTLDVPLGMSVDDLLASFSDDNYSVGMFVT